MQFAEGASPQEITTGSTLVTRKSRKLTRGSDLREGNEMLCFAGRPYDLKDIRLKVSESRWLADS